MVGKMRLKSCSMNISIVHNVEGRRHAALRATIADGRIPQVEAD